MFSSFINKSKQTKRLWYGLITICFLPLFFIQLQSTRSPLLYELMDGAHILIFFIVGWFIFPLISGSVWRRVLVLVVTILLLSFVIEAIQDKVGRAFEWADINRNMLGLALSLSIRIKMVVTTVAAKRTALFAIIGLLMLSTYERITLIKLFAAEVYFRLNAPVLADFNYEFEVANWLGKQATITYVRGGLIVETSAQADYPGAIFRGFPSDWRDFQSLYLNIENLQTEPLTLTLKITDLTHEQGLHHYDERYNGTLLLKPGDNSFTIDLTTIQSAPKNRQLNLHEVNRIDLFRTQPGYTAKFKINTIGLR